MEISIDRHKNTNLFILETFLLVMTAMMQNIVPL